MHFSFFKIRTPFFDSILRTAPGTILNHFHRCPPVICGEIHTLMHGILCELQHPGVKKVIFSKIHKIDIFELWTFFWYHCSTLTLFYLKRLWKLRGWFVYSSTVLDTAAVTVTTRIWTFLFNFDGQPNKHDCEVCQMSNQSEEDSKRHHT